jgi:hypothetical protein
MLLVADNSLRYIVFIDEILSEFMLPYTYNSLHFNYLAYLGIKSQSYLYNEFLHSLRTYSSPLTT